MSSSYYIPLILLLWKHSQRDVRAGGHVNMRMTHRWTGWSDTDARTPRARDQGLGSGIRPREVTLTRGPEGQRTRNLRHYGFNSHRGTRELSTCPPLREKGDSGCTGMEAGCWGLQSPRCRRVNMGNDLGFRACSARLLGRGLDISEPQFPLVEAGISTHGAQDQAGREGSRVGPCARKMLRKWLFWLYFPSKLVEEFGIGPFSFYTRVCFMNIRSRIYWKGEKQELLK